MRVLEFVCVYLNLYACIGICMRALEFVCLYWNLYACIGICMRVSEFVYVFVPMGHRNFCMHAMKTDNINLNKLL